MHCGQRILVKVIFAVMKQLKQLQESPEKNMRPRRDSVTSAIPVRCSINWAMKTLREENRDLKEISRGRRRQNNKTNYTRQKAHVNMWNKADICAVLLSNETSTDPFPRCLQNVADISGTNIHRFVQEETLGSTNFSENRNIPGNQMKDMLNKIRRTTFSSLRRLTSFA